MENKPICPDCFGDGIETCHNPDHGFLGAISGIVSANESACPCCGHNPKHKMKGTCYTCKGTGHVTREEYDSFIDKYLPYDADVDLIHEHCLKHINNGQDTGTA